MTYAGPPARNYRISHLGRRKAREYDRDFWSPDSAKGLDWQLERTLLERIVIASRRPIRCAVDFACGTGRVLAELERHAQRTVGVDISPDMLAIARKRCTRSSVVQCDVTTTAWPADAVELSEVDLVTAFRFFLNAEPELRAAALRWIRSVLAPGGLLVANFHLSPASARGRYLRMRWGGRRLMPMLSVRAAEELLAGAGFETVGRYGYSYLPYRRDGARLWAPRWRARAEEWLLDRAPVRLAGSFFLVGRVAVGGDVDDARLAGAAEPESAGELQAGKSPVAPVVSLPRGKAATR